MANMVLKRYLYEEIYRVGITLYVAHNAVVTYRRVAARFKLDPIAFGDFGALTLWDGEGDLAMLFHKDSLCEADIAHEIKHCADLIMEHIGHSHCKRCSNEPAAYLVGYLTAWVRTQLKRAKLKIR